MGIFSRFKKSNNNISITQLIDETYKQKYFDECKFIWKNYVPKNGQATALQGELLRQLEKLRCEAQDNGNINWDDDFAFFCDFIKETLCTQTIYNSEEKEKYKLILSYLKECGDYAIKYYNGQILDNNLEVDKIAYVKDNLYDIIADAIGYLYICYPNPISFNKNNMLKR